MFVPRNSILKQGHDGKDVIEYSKRMFQPHPDNCLIFGDKEVYHNNININEAEKEEKIKVFKDKKGYGYHFEGMKPVHWVPPVTSKRYSLVIIF